FVKSKPCVMRGAESDTAMVIYVQSPSHLENLRVALLDLLGAFFHAFGVLLHQLDIGELANAGFLDSLLVWRILARPIDQNLLALAPVHPVIEQPGGIGIWRGLEHRAWPGGERRAFRRVDDLDRLAGPLVGAHAIARP